MKSILTLDLGTMTGWALGCYSTHQERWLVNSGQQSFAINGRVDGAGMRYLRFQRWLDEMNRENDIVQVAYEEVKQRAQSVAAGHMYGGFQATLTAWCEANKVPYEAVPVGTIKKHATGKGSGDKKAIIRAMIAKGNTHLKIDKNDTDSNEADALALFYYVSTYATASTASVRPAPDRVPTRRVPVGAVHIPRRPVSR